MRLKKVIATILTLVLIFSVLAIPGREEAYAATGGMVRVYLSSMNYSGTLTSVDITLNGYYQIPNMPEVSLTSRGTYNIYISNGHIYLSGTGIDGMMDMGTKFTVKQLSDSNGNLGTMSFYNPRYGTRSYRGDMQFDISGDGLRMINTVFVEDYLYGVLAGELSNTFPLETLKAQAIIARSYVYNRMISNQPNYEINDTSSDQVYKGYNSSNDVIMRAVNDTAGMLLKYGSSYVNAYFGASNGGQVELPGNAWSSSSSLGCYVMKDDPYDLRNPSSRSASYVFSSEPYYLNSQFLNLIQTALFNSVGGWYDIVRIVDVQLENPVQTDNASKGISRNYRDMRLTVEYNGGWGLQTSDVVLYSIHDTLRYSLFGADSDLRLFSLSKSGDYWTLTLNRYGHGVGMSQRGAQQMANEGFSYKQIIDFYFPGTSIDQKTFSRDSVGTGGDGTSTGNETATAYGTVNASSLNVRSTPSSTGGKIGSLTRGSRVGIISVENGWYKINFGSGTGYISAEYILLDAGSNVGEGGATPTPTPSGTTGGAISEGVVKLSMGSSTLNMRSGPSSGYSVITRLSNGTKLYVHENAANNWLKVKTEAGLEGFVSGDYVTITSTNPGNSATPTPTPTGTTEVTGTVRLSSSSSTLNVRASTSTSSGKLGTLSNGNTVTIVEEINGWYKIKYGAGYGYVATSYIVKNTSNTGNNNNNNNNNGGNTSDGYALGCLTSADIPSGGVAGTVQASGDIALYSDSNKSPTNIKLGNNTSVTVIGVSGDLYQIQINGMAGYVLKQYILTAKPGTSGSNGGTSIPDGYALGCLTSADIPSGGVMGTVVTSGGSLSLYSDTSKSSTSSAVANGAAVQITGVSNDLYNVSIGSASGYVLKAYVLTAKPSSSGNNTGNTNTGNNNTGNTNTGGSDWIKATIQLSSTSNTLRLRKEPSTSADVLTNMPHGASIEVLSQSGDWYNIVYLDYKGYVMKSYVKLANSGQSVPGSSTGGNDTGNTGNTNTGNTGGTTLYHGNINLSDANSSVNVRSSASSSGSVLGTLKHGAAVYVVASNGDWYKIQNGSSYGYVLKSYVKLTGETSTTGGSSNTGNTNTGGSSSENVGKTGTIKLSSASSTLNVRTGAGTDYAVAFTVKHGASVTIKSETGSWYGIEVGGKSGFVKASYVSLSGSGGSSSGSNSTATATTTGSVNLRSSASAGSEKLGTYSKGTSVTVLEKGSEWSKVQVGSKTGYMSNMYLKFS